MPQCIVCEAMIDATEIRRLPYCGGYPKYYAHHFKCPYEFIFAAWFQRVDMEWYEEAVPLAAWFQGVEVI